MKWGTFETTLARSTGVLPEVLRYLVASGSEVYSFAPEKTSLEDMFVRIMGEKVECNVVVSTSTQAGGIR
ncbi:MAG: hypothetical protein ACRD3O_05505 [Terriglobia bacterium]